MKKEDLKILALIPARGGSKRLPEKNIKDFCGKPLIAWTIEAALQSKYIDTVTVSTDCDEIAKISKKHGAQVPFLRPSEIAGDQTGMADVVKHLIAFYQSNGKEYTHIILLQPTSPLRDLCDIDSSIELLIHKEAKAVYSVCESDHSPLWMNTLPENKSFDGFLKPEVVGLRSQDLPTYYRLNGAIYLFDVTSFLEEGSIHTIKNSFAYVMDRKHSIDIDEPIDFIIAQALKNQL